MARLALLLTAAVAWTSQCLALLQHLPPHAARRSPGNATSSGDDDDLLEVVQAATPPRTRFDGYSCRRTLLEHDFANSYGAPYVGLYTPPPPADCPFTTTVLNLSVTSRGQQYDRLALLFLDDVELWRTSTAMPTAGGIRWAFQKDVTAFDALLRAERKIILDLGNVVDGDLYTGVFHVTLEALYYDDAYPAAGGSFRPAQHIYPLTNLSSARNRSSAFSLPDDAARAVRQLALPRAARAAVVSLLASGNAAEEFWYTNVPTPYLDTFQPDAASASAATLYGFGAFREVQLLLDGRLAGVVWPAPVLFTGGVDPGLWRPVVDSAGGAFDLPAAEVDVTPWLPLLCDGAEHAFALRVVGFDEGAADGLGEVGQNWWVTGTVFVWVYDDDEEEGGRGVVDQQQQQNQTAGAGAVVVTTNVSAPVFEYLPRVSTSTAADGSAVNESLWVSLTARRSLSVMSSTRVAAANGTTGEVVSSWTQELAFSSVLNISNTGLDASLSMGSSGTSSSSSSSSRAGGGSRYYSHPLSLCYSYRIAETDAELSSVSAAVDHGLRAGGAPALVPYLTGTALGGGEEVATRQNVSSSYYWNETIVGGIEALDTSRGETWYSSAGVPGGEFGVAAYSRYLAEEDDLMVQDEEAWATMAVPSTRPLSCWF